MDTNNTEGKYAFLERASGAVHADPKAQINPEVLISNGNNIFIGCAVIEKDARLSADETGKIIIEDNVIIDKYVELHAGNNEQIHIGEGSHLIIGFDTRIEGNVTIGKNCAISGYVTNSSIGDESKILHRSIVQWAKIGSGTTIRDSEITGYAPSVEQSESEPAAPDNWVLIGENTDINRAIISTVPDKQSWAFAAPKATETESTDAVLGETIFLRDYQVRSDYSEIGSDTKINSGATLVNTKIGKKVTLQTNAYLENSIVEDDVILKRNTVISLARIGEKSQIGCEVSKSWLGAGVTAVHPSSYISAIIPEEFVIVNDQNEFEVIRCPNLTNISAGMVFESSSGVPTSDFSGTKKGTSFIWSTSFGVNSSVVNLYDHPDILLKYIFREENLTIICPFCLTKGEVCGLIPPFTYADALSSTSHKIGWVLNHNAGQILEDRRRMKLLFGDRPDIMAASDQLIEGSIRLGIRLVKPLRQVAQRKANSASAKLTQHERQYRMADKNLKLKIDRLKAERGKWIKRLSSIEDGLRIYQHHLKSGAWRMKDGEFVNGGWYDAGGQWSHKALSSNRARFL
ncbi:hypothetical protein JXJ21_15580 [candidate division KSB1 bacterium]|nr:hypothetical protein [candidate division KSB1 bacterium]